VLHLGREYDWSKTRIGVLWKRLKEHRNKTAIVVSNYDLQDLLEVANIAACISSASSKDDISKEIELLKQKGLNFYERYSDELPPLEQSTDLLTDVEVPNVMKAITRARFIGGSNVGNATFHLSKIDAGVQKTFNSTVTLKNSITIDTFDKYPIAVEEGVQQLKFSIFRGIYGTIVDAIVSLREVLIDITINSQEPSSKLVSAINYCNSIIHLLEKGC